MTQRKARLAAVGLLAFLGGCYYGGRERYGGGYRAGGPPAARRSSAQTQAMGIGASAGLFMPSDSSYVDGLSTGMMWDIHAALWLGPHVAVKVDFGSSSMVDNGNPGEKMTASPLTVGVLASIPMPMFYGGPGYGIGFQGADDYRWLFGAGIGSMSLSHTSHDVPGSMNVFYITTGGEWLFGYGERFFAAADVYFGDLVRSKTDPAQYWDFRSIYTLRAGIEIGF